MSAKEGLVKKEQESTIGGFISSIFMKRGYTGVAQKNLSDHVVHNKEEKEEIEPASQASSSSTYGTF